jgi:2-polyprenyl-3-methyl-5-hydroxy-6-metoxy-1,4-benzoquinol methylase
MEPLTNENKSKRQTHKYAMIDKKQQLQSNQYSFPYHYVATDNPNRTRLSRHAYFHASYLAANRLFNKFCSEYKSSHGHRHLDIGCGDGAMISSSIHNDIDFMGIDYDQKAIELACMSAKGSFQCLDIAECEKEAFDSISAVEVLEHIPPNELNRFIANSAKVLKKNGAFFITVPSKHKKVTPKHFQHFDEVMLRELLTEDFKIETLVYFEKKNILSLINRIFTNSFFYLEIFNLNTHIVNQASKTYRDSYNCGRILVQCIKK